jgi:dTDP-4-dehydrorhamnose reductase
MSSAPVYLIWGGKTGWLGGKLVKLLQDQGKTVHIAESRLENRESVIKEIEQYKPTHVLDAAGVTGRPNVDWCEANKEQTIRCNVIGTLNIADICAERGIHCTIYATGCIFEYDDAHQIGGKPFTEDDLANFDGSFYSLTKGMVEQMLRVYPHICVLRVRMPISDDLVARNFVTKITKYAKVVNVPNSMTILTEMLPASLCLAEKKKTGIYNFCNPGAISHNEILEMYKKHIDPKFTYTNFSVEEQDKILVGRRSNNELSSGKLVEALGDDCKINEIHVAMEECFKRMRAQMEKEGTLPAAA